MKTFEAFKAWADEHLQAVNHGNPSHRSGICYTTWVLATEAMKSLGYEHPSNFEVVQCERIPSPVNFLRGIETEYVTIPYYLEKADADACASMFGGEAEQEVDGYSPLLKDGTSPWFVKLRGTVQSKGQDAMDEKAYRYLYARMTGAYVMPVCEFQTV